MKSIIVCFAAILLTIALPFIFQSLDNAITDDYSQSFAGISTAAGAYSVNITLSRSIYRNDSKFVTEVSSNISNDIPSASSFNSASRALEIGGLDASSTRTLVVNYKIDSVTLDTSMVLFFSVLRWFFVFVLIGMAGGAIYAFFD